MHPGPRNWQKARVSFLMNPSVGIENIFFNWKKIFWKIFLTKYLQKIFAIPKFYTILELWDQMPPHGFDKNLIWRNLFFNIQRGDPLNLQKQFLQCRGGNIAWKKILQNQKFLKLKYIQECPVKCLWLKSKIAQLS